MSHSDGCCVVEAGGPDRAAHAPLLKARNCWRSRSNVGSFALLVPGPPRWAPAECPRMLTSTEISWGKKEKRERGWLYSRKGSPTQLLPLYKRSVARGSIIKWAAGRSSTSASRADWHWKAGRQPTLSPLRASWQGRLRRETQTASSVSNREGAWS